MVPRNVELTAYIACGNTMPRWRKTKIMCNMDTYVICGAKGATASDGTLRPRYTAGLFLFLPERVRACGRGWEVQAHSVPLVANQSRQTQIAKEMQESEKSQTVSGHSFHLFPCRRGTVR